VRAIVITNAGGPEVLEVQTRPTPEPGLGQIRVRVRTSALNRADLAQREGSYPAPPGAPADIPGLEYAGEVDALGPGSTMWRVGDRVMGIVGGGAHAEYLCTHEREALPIPTNLSYEEAAAIPEVFMTAYDAIFRQMHARTGERLLVHAIGSGVGTAALQLARVAGVTVIGTSRSATKLARAHALGLDIGIDAMDANWAAHIEARVGKAAVHMILDLVGGDYFPTNLRVLAERGRMIVVGLTAGRRSEIDLGVVLGKRLQILGTVLRARPLEEKITLARDFAERVVPLFASARLHPVLDRVFSFTNIRAAHEHLQSNATFGKVVLRWE
jgi:putative PIG3 family NAD(P)H quinone oxidoreductase